MKITPEIIEQINELYLQIGVKKRVAEIVGCAASTVSKYIIPNYVSKENQKEFTFDGIIGDSEWMIDIFQMFDSPARRFCELCMLGDNEIEDMRELQKEVYF